MTELLEPQSTASAGLLAHTRDVVQRVRSRIAPLWDLPNYVAVNPFLGFAHEPLPHAAESIESTLDAQVLPAAAYYQARWREGQLTSGAVTAAAARLGQDPAPLLALLEGRTPCPTGRPRVRLTLAEEIDLATGSRWSAVVLKSLTRWCAVHAAEEQLAWRVEEAHEGGLLASWLEAARVDRAIEIAGLSGWRAWMGELPTTPFEAIDLMLHRSGVAPADQEAYLYRLAGSVLGWASYYRRPAWVTGTTDAGEDVDLLAIRLAADVAVNELAPRPKTKSLAPAKSKSPIESAQVRAALQEALEDEYLTPITRGFAAATATFPSASRPNFSRPEVQALFCIDVRSEPFRRSLEAQSEHVSTLGFAGFFGISLDLASTDNADPTTPAPSARCPVLLTPAYRVAGRLPAPWLDPATKLVQSAPGAAFSFVEVAGLAFGAGLAAKLASVGQAPISDESTCDVRLNADATTRADIAEGILKNTSLGSQLARLVIFCGHGGRSTNNAHAAGLDCGACGGHGGAVNARIAAQLLNDPAVRTLLTERGRHIPSDTVFVPALHDTAADEVELLDVSSIPSTHTADVLRLREQLTAAAALTRAQRAPGLGVPATSDTHLRDEMERRAADWSEVRPEWGLARNAAFIAARRQWTRALDLEGRSFLHEYDSALDTDNSILTLILVAPMVVASWINLQYFASTVDNDMFGAGNKTLHNRVGTVGVVLGNGGDLRTGLPLQSVHAAGGAWYHEPLRLQVIVEAPPERLDAVIAAQPSVRNLVENGWVRLFSLNPQTAQTHRRIAPGNWQPV